MYCTLNYIPILRVLHSIDTQSQRLFFFPPLIGPVVFEANCLKSCHNARFLLLSPLGQNTLSFLVLLGGSAHGVDPAFFNGGLAF